MKPTDISADPKIDCPNPSCDGSIPIRMEDLFKGRKIQCPQCNTELTLDVKKG